jgi:molybdate transport system substrate-binding protein
MPLRSKLALVGGKTARRLALQICGLLALLLVPAAQAQADRPLVAAASDLQFALPQLAREFERATGRSVRLSFGSSGNFRRQIAQGAPFELYLSADEAYVEALYIEGHTVDAGALYARGRIVLIRRRTDRQEMSLQRLREALSQGQIRRFAIANPEHAPYGRAAKEALQAAGQWELIRPRLVLAENVSQAAQFALAPEADGGIVSYSLALASPLAQRSQYALIPEQLHSPLRQRMALIKGAGETARAFYDYLQQPQAKSILMAYGFTVPTPE